MDYAEKLFKIKQLEYKLKHLQKTIIHSKDPSTDKLIFWNDEVINLTTRIANLLELE